MNALPFPGAEDLAISFPDVYLDLQSAHLQVELADENHFQATVTQSGKSAEAVILLNDGYALVLTPTVPGFEGYKNWMMFRSIVDPRSKRKLTLTQYRCGVELVQGFGTGDPISLLTFGIDDGNIADVVNRALEKVKERCGLRLVVLPVVHVESAPK